MAHWPNIGSGIRIYFILNRDQFMKDFYHIHRIWAHFLAVNYANQPFRAVPTMEIAVKFLKIRKFHRRAIARMQIVTVIHWMWMEKHHRHSDHNYKRN